jgi:hypothetical protein
MIIPSTPHNGILITIMGCIIAAPFFIWASILHRRQIQAKNEPLSIEQARETKSNNITQFMDVRLDSLMVNEANSWVSADVVIASRLPYSMNIVTVHAVLWFLYEDGKRHRYDLKTHKGEVCGDVSGEVGKRDLTVRVHVDDEKLSESLRKSVHTCGYGWANVEGKIYITTSDSGELLLELNEKTVHVIRTSAI